MNKNVENYKKAIDEIHVDQNLKDKVLEKANAKKESKSPIYYLRYAVAVAAVAVVAVVGVSFANKPKEEILTPKKSDISKNDKIDTLAKVDIRRFESMEELREVLSENNSSGEYYNGLDYAVEESAVAVDSAKSMGDSFNSQDTSGASTSTDYSRTNNQVESVDEADIVKTDGKYIYYSQNNRVYIVDTDLKLKATIKDDDIRPYQIFVNGNKLVIFGVNYNNSRTDIDYDIENDDVNILSELRERNTTVYRQSTLIRVYYISNIEKPELKREISLDGNYQDARMIEDNIYLVTSYYPYFYYDKIEELKDSEILPSYEDSICRGVSYIEATDIAYFENTGNYGYSLIAGFNLNSDEEVNVETFFGSGTEMYVSENNMYIIAPKYEDYWYVRNSTIYKFELEDASVTAVAEGEVKGYVDDQFSIDEYEGNLRIATTSYEDSYRKNFLTNEYVEPKYTTHLTILNKDLEKIGEIEDLVKDERIYAVRFIGKVGYIVTFEQIDPLWVIDLSDPTNPTVKGALEIPGYSSYLHPYDETHIIGIGYNVKDNGYGGVTNDTIKISMFDVSDLENPKEIFNKTLDNSAAYSDIMYEHKALFFNKAENLIGFPISWWSRRENKSGLLLYRIDMENKEFEELDDLIENTTYSSIERAVYIGKAIYTIHQDRIIKYDLKTLEKIGELELEYEEEYYYYYR